ncbi:hypothetical protein [Coleofasciculus sp. G2-EDA-02]|uniref:hypothetical protein n=1 Tax=Coleofasciculus sp. G2-EDA-02 TaxID=3069529 RepID=UPI003301F012
MSPRKLTETDKKDILNLYRRPEETTSTLADRYGVSNSTISRLLKSSLLESDYETLIQQKRANRTPGTGTSGAKPKPKLLERIEPKFSVTPSPQPSIESEDEESEDESSVSEYPNQRRRRRRSSVVDQLDIESTAKQGELPLDFNRTEAQRYTEDSEDLIEEIEQVETNPLEKLLDDEDLMDLDEDLDEDWDEDEEDIATPEPLTTTYVPSGVNVQVLPLSQASFPKPCYLVIDRAAELIARPLREFSDLGRIPAEEVQQQTLPVFDNHRVARRFSNRSQRVIKVPDGQMLQKTCSYLQAKGITRLLIDGQVYSLLAAPLLE